jgi:hypothetical protein
LASKQLLTFFEACWSIRIMQSVQFHYFPPNDKLWNNNERWIKCSVKIRICWLEQVLRIDFNVCISKSRIDLMNFPHKMMHFLQFEYGYTNSQSFKHEVGTAGNNVIKCFCSLFYVLENKLDCFGLVIIFPTIKSLLLRGAILSGGATSPKISCVKIFSGSNTLAYFAPKCKLRL